ncbi:hypothetical protein ACT7C1_11575 [Bacillus paranthracis]
MKEVRQQVTPDQAKKVKEVYDNLSTADQNKPKETNISYDRLSKQEKQLYKKLEELDAVKKRVIFTGSNTSRNYVCKPL